MTSDNERALEAFDKGADGRDPTSDKCHYVFSYKDVGLIRTALQRDDSVVEDLVTALEPFANALVKAEETISQEVSGVNRSSHVIRTTTYWLSYNDFARAIKALSKFKASRGKI